MIRGRLAVTGFALVAAVLYAVFAIQEHRHLRTATYDLVIFDQAARGYSRFGAPVSAAKGVHNGFGASFSVLGDHFSPVLAVFGPLYRIADEPVTLLIAQAMLIAVSVLPVHAVARRHLGEVAALLIAAGYLLAWPLQEALASDVHEVAFAIPLVALALERWDAERYTQALAAVLALLLVKEDLGLLVAAFGLLFLLRGQRVHAAVAVVLGLATVAIATLVFIPAAGGRADYYWSYDALGPDVPAACWHVLTHPLDALQLVVTPAAKWHTVLWLLAPLALLPLFSPVVLLCVPFLLERMLSANPNYWSTDHHYNSVLTPILTVAAVDGYVRLQRWLAPRAGAPVAIGWSAAVLVGSLALCTTFPFQRLAESDEWRTTATMRSARQIMSVVPDGVVVEAGNKLGPHLTDRTRVLLLDRTPRDAEWVVADVGRGDFPFDHPAEVQSRVDWLLTHGYHVVKAVGGFVALERDAA